MKHLIEVLTAVLLAALIVFVCASGFWIHREIPLIHDALWNTAESSWDLKQNSGEQLQETRKATAAIKNLFDHTDITLNGPKAHPGLIPQATVLVTKAQPAMDNLTAAIGHLNNVAEHLDALVRSGTATMDELRGTIKVFQGAIADVDKLITDPKIRETLDNLAATTKDLDGSIQQLNLMLQSATATAQDIQAVADKVREQYTKARNLYYALFKELLSVGSQGVQFFMKK